MFAAVLLAPSPELGRPSAWLQAPLQGVPSHRRAWKLTRALAEGTAMLLSAAWQQHTADVTTIFVPLAGTVLERVVSWRVAQHSMHAVSLAMSMRGTISELGSWQLALLGTR